MTGSGVAYTTEQLQVTCSSHSPDDSCGDAECTCNALNGARTCTTYGVEFLNAADTDTPDIVEYEHVDLEQLAEKEQAVSQAETDENLAKQAAVSKFKQHIAEQALEHQAEVEAEIRVKEENAAELQSKAGGTAASSRHCVEGCF